MKKLFWVFNLVLCCGPATGWCYSRLIHLRAPSALQDSGNVGALFSKIHPMGRFSALIDSNIVQNPTLHIDKWLSTLNVPADLGSIAEPGHPLEMIAFGGGLTAGVANGGVTRESQQTSYPSLLAHQMGIRNFAMPLFDKAHYNGTGIYVYSITKGPYPRWNAVINNTIALTDNPITMPEYEGKISNFAFPGGNSMWFMRGNSCENCDLELAFMSRFKPLLHPYPSQAFDKIKAEIPYNFVIIEDFFDRWMRGIQTTSQFGIYDESFNGSILNTGKITDYSINMILDKGQKGVIFTIPRYQDLPYMNWYSTEELRKRASQLKITYNRNNEAVELDATHPFYLIPTAKVHALFENFRDGDVFEANFDDIEIIDSQESFVSDPKQHYNQKIAEFAKEKNLALVDLADLYQRIHEGGFKTEEGIAVDGTTYGNFFSSDGIYPTPLGQAIITNEVIKAINAHYGSKIPSISIAEFSRAVGIGK